MTKMMLAKNITKLNITKLLRKIFFFRLKAFSLVEISMVLIIIGLLITAISKGRELIEQAKIRSVISQVEKYKSALAIFHEKYDSLPGDFSKANETFGLKSGNGDGNIDGDSFNPETEAGQFWKHLSAANLITDVNPKVNEGGIGKNIPSAKIGDGWIVVQNPENLPAGIYLTLISKITPKEAYSIDKALDYGIPDEGFVRSNGDGCISNSSYNVQSKDKNCKIYVLIK
jgi:competence protein ComGC